MRYRLGHLFAVLALGASGVALSSLSVANARTITSVRSVPVPPSVDTLQTAGDRLEASGCNVGGGVDFVDPVTRRARTGGARAVGPTIMRFAGYCSTTRPISAYTASSLWLYDCAVGPSGHGGEAVRLSGSTGALESTVDVPGVCYTTFAADEYGAFVGSYDNPGPLYFASNGAHHAVVALRTAGRVNWLYSSGGSVFADIGPAGRATCQPVACGVWRFSGAGAKASLVLVDPAADKLVSTPVLAGVELFSFVLAPTAADDATVLTLVSIDLDRPHLALIARLRLPGIYSGPPVLAWCHGSLFVLTPMTLCRYDLQ